MEEEEVWQLLRRDWRRVVVIVSEIVRACRFLSREYVHVVKKQ